MSLENETPEIKLAVDLIMLLEDNQIAPNVVLAALEIVRRDYQSKADSPPTKGPPDAGASVPAAARIPRHVIYRVVIYRVSITSCRWARTRDTSCTSPCALCR